MDKTLPGANSPGQSGPGSNGNEWLLRIPQSSSITGTSPLDGSVPFSGHSLGESHPLEKSRRCIKKGLNPQILPVYVLNITTIALLPEWFSN